jgi:hypothetical protein
MGFKQDAATSLYEVAILYQKEGKHAQAIDFFLNSLEFAMETEMKALLASIYQGLTISYEKTDDFEQAYLALQNYYLYSASVVEMNNRELRNTENEASNTNSDKAFNYQILFLVLFVIMLFTTIIYRRLYLKEKKKNLQKSS